MAKQRSERAARRAEERAAQKAQQRNAKEEVTRQYTLLDCMKLGLIANVLFVVFIIVCLIYYYSLAKYKWIVIPYEIFAYTVEAAAFALFTLSVIWMDRLVRARAVMKVMMLVYIAVEVFLMLLEFKLIPIESYNGLALWLTIVHSIFSAGTAFTLIMLDSSNKRMETIVIITSTVMLAGMFLGMGGWRVYASILLNAFAYIFFYTATFRQLKLEEISVDCYGDKAESTVFSSSMFADAPQLVEKPEKPKETLSEKARKAAKRLDLENTEREVLTDDDEKFEYEFGVIEDDDDEYEDDYDEYEDYEDDEDGESQ